MQTANRFAVAWMLCTLCATASAASGRLSQSVRLDHDGRERSYRLAAPADVKSPAPLVIALHGGGGNGRQMQRAFQLDALAAARGIVVVYPDAIRGTWNDGREAENFQDTTIDDAGFVLAVVDSVAGTLPIDRSRVYVFGVSNGAMMTQRLACERAAVFAAFASLIAQLPERLADRCSPDAPAPLMLVVGTADPLVPFGGGTVLRNRGRVISARATIDFWRGHNGCQPGSTRTTYDRDPNDATRTQVETFEDGCRAAPVVLVTVEGGGHTWPGGPQYLGKRLIGPASNDLDSRELLLDFFGRHQR